MPKDIVLFYYYSSPALPESCFLHWRQDISYRNMLMFPGGGNKGSKKIHFEFPVFEDHSYNTICNLDGMRSLIKRPSNNEKYIILRTKNFDSGRISIVGYYKVRKAFYIETKLFNNNGFVCGVESVEQHLLKKDELEYCGPKIRQGYRNSWRTEVWGRELNEIFTKISDFEDVSKIYQTETNRLISIFKDSQKMQEWREHCEVCENKTRCTFYRRNRNYQKYNSSESNFCDF